MCFLYRQVFNFRADPVLFSIWYVDKFNSFIKVFPDNLFYFIKRDIKKFTSLVDHIDFLSSNALCNAASRAGASSEKIIAWTSNLKGTEAFPSSSTLSCGSSLRVIPILYMFSPNEPILEIFKY